jgi:PAS domain S-box-containing protein
MKITADISIHKLIDSSHDLLCVLNADMQLVNISTAMATLWGYSKNDLIGHRFTNFVWPQDVEAATKFIASIMAGADSINFKTAHVHKNGSAIPLLWSVTWLPNDELLFCVGRKGQAKQDAEILLNETMLSLEKSIERFEYVTEATTDIIWDWDLETNEVYYSRNIEKSFGHKPGVNVGNMRFFAQYVHPDDRERVVLYADPVKHGTMNYWTEKYRFHKANGKYAYVLDKGVIIRDENGVIKISAKQDGQQVLIKVKDNGIGMSAEQTEKLFKGKVDSMRGTHEELGTGMGLLFCKDLIEKCNGKIWVSSEKGVGTEFSFTIPLGVAGRLM